MAKKGIIVLAILAILGWYVKSHNITFIRPRQFTLEQVIINFEAAGFQVQRLGLTTTQSLFGEAERINVNINGTQANILRFIDLDALRKAKVQTTPGSGEGVANQFGFTTQLGVSTAKPPPRREPYANGNILILVHSDDNSAQKHISEIFLGMR